MKGWKQVLKKEITVNAKSLEEALEIGAAQFGVAQDQLTYEVIEDAKRGFLGMGGSLAKVRISYILPPTNVAQAFVEMLLEDMELDGDVKSTVDKDGDTLIEVTGENAGVLIGHHGDTLDAIQYLCNLAANRKDDENRPFTKVTVDIEGYRARRAEALRSLARRTAAKVKKYQRNVTLEPMNPYERRIIHSEIQTIDGVTTHSVGQDSARRVVVMPADENGNPVKGASERAERAAERDAERPARRSGSRASGHRTPRPARKPEREKSVASYFGDEEYTDDYMLDEKGEPLDIAKICGIYEEPEEDTAENASEEE